MCSGLSGAKSYAAPMVEVEVSEDWREFESDGGRLCQIGERTDSQCGRHGRCKSHSLHQPHHRPTITFLEINHPANTQGDQPLFLVEMPPYDSESSDEGEEYTETNTLLGYATKIITGDSVSHLGGVPVGRLGTHLAPETNIVCRRGSMTKPLRPAPLPNVEYAMACSASSSNSTATSHSNSLAMSGGFTSGPVAARPVGGRRGVYEAYAVYVLRRA
jgi:hypothetical protein